MKVLMEYAINEFNTLVSALAGAEQGLSSGSSTPYTQLYKDIQSGNKRVSPMVIEDTRVVSGATSQNYFDDGDNKETGVRNLASGRLAKGQFFLPVAMAITGVYDGTNAITLASLKNKSFLDLASLNNGMGLENGEITFRVEDSPIFKDLSLMLFDTRGRDDLGKGVLPLGPSEIIRQEQKIEATIKFAATVPDHVAVRIALIGAGTYTRAN